MLLHIKFTDPTGDLKSFFVFCTEIEKHLEILNSFVANGFPVYAAQLTNTKGEIIVLPVKAFPEKPTSDQLNELEMTYKTILNL